MKSQCVCPLNSVQVLHAIAAFLHGASFVSMIVFWIKTDSQNYPKVYTTNVVWRQELDPTVRCTDVAKGCIIVSSLSDGYEVNVYAIFLAFFLVSCVFEAYYVQRQFAGYWRWIEYAISASLQTFAIAVVCNVLNVFVASLSALMVGALQYFGFAIEQEQEQAQAKKITLVPSDTSSKLKFYAKVPTASPALTQMHFVLSKPQNSKAKLSFGFLMLIFAWTPIFYHYFYNLNGPPAFVHVIFWCTFVAYCLFGIVMALKCSQLLNNTAAEISYTVLSLFSKLSIAWAYVGGTYMRNGNIRSTT